MREIDNERTGLTYTGDSMSIEVVKSGITREQVEGLHSVYGWLNEAEGEYQEQAEILRDIYCFLTNMLDVKAGIQQGYLTEGICDDPI